MIIVTGASGKVGQELVRQLQEQQAEFKAVVHSDKSAASLQAEGVTVAQGDLSDTTFIRELLAGADSLFLLTGGSLTQEQNLIDAAKEAGARKVVKLSVMAAEDKSVPLFEPHLLSEQFLKASGLDYVILRPNYFMQNFFNSAATIKELGQLFSTTGEHRISLIDTADIAAVAVVALTTDRLNGQTLDLTGPEALNWDEIAQKFSEQLDRRVQYVDISDEAFGQALLSNGLPPAYADGLVKLNQFYRADKGAVVTNAVEQSTGRKAGTLASFIARHRAAF